MTNTPWRRIGAVAAAILMAAGLAACVIMPGKFASALDLRRDGHFAFSYTGEIRMLALSSLARKGAKPQPFSPSECHDDKMDVRPCTKAELAEQRRQWDEEQKATAERRAREAGQMKALLGGIDPESPQAAEELATRLRRQAGWKSVTYKGDGLFAVDYAISGRLDHDFAFPTIERFPMASPFIQLTRRADGTVRVDAPGFGGGAQGGSPLAALLAMDPMAGIPEHDENPAKAPTSKAPASKTSSGPAGPTLDGTFTLVTDGKILANNTDEGPRPTARGGQLDWVVNLRTRETPTALIGLDAAR